MTLFESSVKAPLLIAAPGLKKNRETNRVVELLDIYPTLTDLCGLQPPAKLSGVSLKPLLLNPLKTWNRPAYTQVTFENRDGRSVRDERFRYTEWFKGSKGIELYDYKNDPDEINNLSGKKEYALVENKLAKLLHNQ